MKLSTAIRLGAMLHRQCFLVDRVQVDGVTIATCALTAAFEAGYAPHPFAMTVRSCPGCAYTRPLAWVIVHLNDDHRWTREQIAAWVATVEPADPDGATAPVPGDTLVWGSRSR
jgi:hypothetical protein